MSIPKIFSTCLIFASGLFFSNRTLQAQEINIPAETYPFQKIVEWKGKGAILFNQDPSGNNKKVNLTHVNSQATSVWNQPINPRNEKQYMIYSENTRYVYFLDNLELENNTYFFNQLNEAGTVKQASTNLLSQFKKLGDYLPEDSELLDVVVTDKSIIHIFKHFNKKEKKHTQLAFFMTHNNFLVYGVVLGEKFDKDLENEDIGFWKYIGFDGDDALFAARDVQERKKGFAIQKISSKGKLNVIQFLPMPEGDLEYFENVGYGLNGANYLDKKTLERASIRSINGKMYALGIDKSSGSRNLKLWELKENKWQEIQKHSMPASKKANEIGITMLNEGLGLKVGEGSKSELIFLGFSPVMKPNVLPFTANSIYNPSRFIVNDRKTDFVSVLSDGNLYFDYNQLGKEGNMNFEFVKK